MQPKEPNQMCLSTTISVAVIVENIGSRMALILVVDKLDIWQETVFTKTTVPQTLTNRLILKLRSMLGFTTRKIVE